MLLELVKFGKILNSRTNGREAVMRAKQIINGTGVSGENIILDLKDVEVLTPSFADEFIRGIQELYEKKEIKIQGYENNSSVKQTLQALGFI